MTNDGEVYVQEHEEWAIEEIRRRRCIAYSDPLNGSDRLFVKADRMKVMQQAGWEAVQDSAVARYNEIKQSMPLPQAAG